MYTSCYLKFGFYLSHSFLENRRSRKSFPEMVFVDAISSSLSPWTMYEPDAPDSIESMKKALEDNLMNLTGPWSTYVPDLEEALGDIVTSMTRTL